MRMPLGFYYIYIYTLKNSKLNMLYMCHLCCTYVEMVYNINISLNCIAVIYWNQYLGF